LAITFGAAGAARALLDGPAVALTGPYPQQTKATLRAAAALALVTVDLDFSIWAPSSLDEMGNTAVVDANA
jgi:hypothetical protein